MADAVQQQAQVARQTKVAESAGPKNIVICCDGTGNEFGDTNSNVVKFYTALMIDDGQVGYYHPGVGTMGDPAARGPIARKWSQIIGMAFAFGFKDNVFDAYRYLMTIYNDGDHVFLFGFSRGAYTVRALAGLLDGYGLLCKGNEGHIPYAWRLYTEQLQDRRGRQVDGGKQSARAFKEAFSRKNFMIQFIGIWDTVSSVGWITSPLRLFNVAQNPSIRNGRQAISVDERRCFYADNLWGDPLMVGEPPEKQDILQVWFSGVHSDVGGSYEQKDAGLSNITLEWMLLEAQSKGVKLVEERVDVVLGRPAVEENYRATRALYKTPKSNEPHESLRGWWWLLEFLPHIYYDKDRGVELRRVPLGARRELPAGSLVHHTVKERIDRAKAHAAQRKLDGRRRLGPLHYQPDNVTCGTLTAVPIPETGHQSQAQSDPLYRYEPGQDQRSNTFKRLSVLWAFILLYVVLAFVLVQVGIELFAHAWPVLEHGLVVGSEWVIGHLDGIDHWVLRHIGF